jgi:hypothetical protein
MIVDKELADKRMAICDSCEHLKEVLTVKTCSLCGCVMKIKIELNIAACPKGKW